MSSDGDSTHCRKKYLHFLPDYCLSLHWKTLKNQPSQWYFVNMSCTLHRKSGVAVNACFKTTPASWRMSMEDVLNTKNLFPNMTSEPVPRLWPLSTSHFRDGEISSGDEMGKTHQLSMSVTRGVSDVWWPEFQKELVQSKMRSGERSQSRCRLIHSVKKVNYKMCTIMTVKPS